MWWEVKVELEVLEWQWRLRKLQWTAYQKGKKRKAAAF